MKIPDDRVTKEFSVLFPGWEIINSADMRMTGNAKRDSGVEEPAFVSLPRNAETPCVIRKSVNIPAKKKTTLKLTVGNVPKGGGSWQLMVRVDMADHFIQTIDAGKKMVWKNLEIDLSEFAGKRIELELYNNPVDDWTKSYAAWKSIEIVSE